MVTPCGELMESRAPGPSIVRSTWRTASGGTGHGSTSVALLLDRRVLQVVGARFRAAQRARPG